MVKHFLILAALLLAPAFASGQVVYELACPAESQPVNSGAGVTFNPLTGKYRANICVDSFGTVTFTASILPSVIGGVQYAASYAGISTTCGITEAINALPNKRGKVILQNGNCSSSGWPVAITTPVVIEGQGMGGPNDAGTNASVVAGSSLTNTSTGSTFFTISLPGGTTSLQGVTLRDFAMIGNKAIGGATAGDCVDVNGGTTAQQVRMIQFQNLQCNQPKGIGFLIQDNAFMINFDAVQVDQSGSHCYVIQNGPNSGITSQIHFKKSTADLCGGANG